MEAPESQDPGNSRGVPGHVGAMLALCWLFFRSWALLGRALRLLLRFVGACGRLDSVLVRSKPVSARSGESFGSSQALFASIFCTCELAMRKRF